MLKTVAPVPHYDLTDLRVFLAVADAGNVSRGAERCHLAPSTASLRLKGLEDAVGTALFTRHARGVTLTRAGSVMIEHARRCVAQLEQMHVDLMPFAQGLAGHITIFANNNAICSHLPEDLSRFFTAHPSVRITLQEHLSSEIVSAVAAGRADVGVAALETNLMDLDYLPYRVDQLVVLAPLHSPVAQRARIRFADCLSEPFISLQQGAALHTFLMDHANSLGKRLDVRVQVSGYGSVARLVASGAGIGIVPRSALMLPEHGQIACIELAEPWARRELRVCVQRTTSETNHFVRSLLEILCPRTGEDVGAIDRPR